ncbi:hypothetical protein SLE2022_404430 [Rubroshorea leprosula]
MILNCLSRQNQNQPPLSLALTLLRRHLSTSASKLHDLYCFKAPPSLSPNPQRPNPYAKTPKKKQKPQCRSSSSLDKVKTVHSDLPFDFRFSYTESSLTVRPIGLRGPKYSPFGPGRLDREWTGVCAPIVASTSCHTPGLPLFLSTAHSRGGSEADWLSETEGINLRNKAAERFLVDFFEWFFH